MGLSQLLRPAHRPPTQGKRRAERLIDSQRLREEKKGRERSCDLIKVLCILHTLELRFTHFSATATVRDASVFQCRWWLIYWNYAHLNRFLRKRHLWVVMYCNIDLYKSVWLRRKRLEREMAQKYEPLHSNCFELGDCLRASDLQNDQHITRIQT